MGLWMVFSLVARAATLGNSCNLHKCKMAAMESGFASMQLHIIMSNLWDITSG